MTKEGTGPTEKWVDEKDARYPYTYDKDGLGAKLGVSGIPAAFLVDATGTIVWQGHPASLTNKIIEANLDGVLSMPLYEWPKAAKSAKKAFLAGKYADAIEDARDLAEDSEDGKRVLAAIEAMVSGRVTKMEAALKQGDVLTALNLAKSLAKGVKDLPEEETVKATLKSIAKDKQLKGWLKDQEELAEIKAEELRKESDCEAVIRDLEKLLKGNEGSFVGDEIEAYLNQVKKLLHKFQ